MDKIIAERSKITLFVDELTTGGAQRVLLFLARELVKKGHYVDFVVLSDSGELFSQVDVNINVVNLSTMSQSKDGPLVVLASLFKLTRYFREKQPHGILSTITGSNLLSVVAWFLAGRPGRLILREATSLRNVSSKFRFWIMSFLYKRATAVIALTSVHAQEFMHAFDINKKRLTVIGNPVDSEYLDRSMFSFNESLAKDYSPYLVAVGRLTKAKDFSTLIKAYSLLDKRGDFPSLVIVGDGPEKNTLKELIAGLSLQGKVFLAGHCDAPSGWYANAEGFVLSSLWEGYPNALLEALYFSLPVLVTRYDSSIEGIISSLGVQRFEYAKPGDPEDIARGLKALCNVGGHNKVSVDSSQIVESYESILLNR